MKDWNVKSVENGTMHEIYCYKICMERKSTTNIDVIILSNNNCNINGIPCPTDTECPKPRVYFQCKCRESIYVKIWLWFDFLISKINTLI
jgi:hypothetical protein